MPFTSIPRGPRAFRRVHGAAAAPPAARPHASSPQSDDAAVPEEPSSPRERAASSAEEDWHMVGDDPFATLAEADRQYSSPV